MKVFGVIMKVVIALAAVAGAVYLAATYGDKLVARAKKLLGGCKCCDGETCCCNEDCCCDDADAADEVAAAAEDTTEAEAPAVEESTAAASEADFEG